MVRHRVRIRFSKQSSLRLIGHRDLMRCFERLMRRAGLPLGFSEGFHPKPRMTFPLALAVGIEGTEEVMELELAEALSAEEVLARLAPCALPGLAIRSVEVLAPESKKARVCSVCYQAPVPPPRRAGLPERIGQLLAAATCPVERPQRGTRIDLRASLEALALEDGVLHFRLRAGSDGCAGPRDVLAALGLPELEQEGVYLTRTAVEVGP